jgi:hypothetical protein
MTVTLKRSGNRIPLIRHPVIPHPLVWHLKVVQRPEVPPSLTSGVRTDFVTLSWVMWTLFAHRAIIMASEESKDEQTRYCWQQETCNFNDSSEN